MKFALSKKNVSDGDNDDKNDKNKISKTIWIYILLIAK